MLELLAPAGNLDAVIAAVQNGADAVYMGFGDGFNARRSADNFTRESFAKAVRYCHIRGCKVYVTLNTLVGDREMEAAAALAQQASDAGADAILVQDLGLARVLRDALPDIPLHASTQMSIHNLAGVEAAAEMGITRAVLSRELSLEQIRFISQHASIETEVFVHGALCMCYSGQCYLSGVIGRRSGNRGQCAQPCRLPYGYGRFDQNRYPLSLKDNCLIEYLRDLERMGVANAVVLNEDTTRIAAALPEFFDRVLVDAPCSGEGMFRKEPVALQQHCEALVKQCAELGAQILDCAAAALAPGGQLVYSTCTFAPEEDEGQVAAFLQRHPEFTLADVFGNVDYSFGSPGESNRTGGLPLDVSKVRRIWPCQGGEGHFMARLVKAGTPRTLPPEGEYTPEEQLWLAAAAQAGKKGKGKAKPAKAADARSTRRADSRACRDAVQGTSRRTRDTGAGEATPAQSLAAWQEFARQYFPALADRPAVVHGGSVLLPVPFPQTGLHVLRAGVFVGSVQKGRFVPEHHLFTAFGGLCTNCEQLTLADCRCTEYLSGREVEARTAADGWCCVTVDGWPLGGGKVSGGRVKNHYPKALRLL